MFLLHYIGRCFFPKLKSSIRFKNFPTFGNICLISEDPATVETDTQRWCNSIPRVGPLDLFYGK
jgi:hypothetical protein